MNCFLIKHINLKKNQIQLRLIFQTYDLDHETTITILKAWSWGHDYNIEGKPEEKSQSRVFNQPKDKR